MMLKNNMMRKIIKINQEKKQKLEEDKKREIEKQKTKINSANVAPSVKLPGSTIQSKLTENYGKIKEIMSLLKEENSALDQAVNEIFKHNRFIRDKTVENERRLKQILSQV